MSATGMIPVPITDRVLTAHSVAEPSAGEVAWDAVTSFGLGAKVIVGAPQSTVTISAATPAVITWANNGLPNGTPVILTTTGALPAGLTANQIYYVVNRANGSFQLSTEVGGDPVATTTAGSGTHTATASIHRAFQSLVASNANNPPAITTGDKWFDLGPTNRWAMLDLYQPSVTWGVSPMTFTLTPGQVISALVFGTLTATQITVVQKRAGVTLKTWTRNLLRRTVQNFADYWYRPFTPQQAVLINDLYLYSDATIEVTLTRDSGLVGIGEVVMGNPVTLGQTKFGARLSFQNYSKFDRNVDGTPQKPVRRRNVPTTGLPIQFDPAILPAIMQFIDAANGQVVVVAAVSDDTHPFFEATLRQGILRSVELELNDTKLSQMSLATEEY